MEKGVGVEAAHLPARPLPRRRVDEIARWVVGFGGRVAVVEPEELRRRVVEIAAVLRPAQWHPAGLGRPRLMDHVRPPRLPVAEIFEG